MIYQEKILELIFDKSDNALFDWVSAQPVLEQVNILKEFREIVQDMLAKAHDSSQSDTLVKFETTIDTYQEAYLDEQLASLQVDIAIIERDKIVNEMYQKMQEIRESLQVAVETNAPNAKEMKELAKSIIALEKQNGIYNPIKWSWHKE